MSSLRKIIEIDPIKCNGCGECVAACAEGAIQIRDGKANLVSDVYRDGLGACLGECSQGAIKITERVAAAFDEQATARHLESLAGKQSSGCPGAAVQSFSLPLMQNPLPPPPSTDATTDSALTHWPIQLRLIPATAPFLADADLLLVADCVPFAYADFHKKLLRGRPVAVTCPKLDDQRVAIDKLAAVLGMSTVRSLTVLHMEVPCCTGLVRVAEAAIQASGRAIPLDDITISVRGKVLPTATGKS